MHSIPYLFIFSLLIFGRINFAREPKIPKIDYVSILSEQPEKKNPNSIWYDDFEKENTLSSSYHDVNTNNNKFKISDGDAFGGSKYSLEQKYEKDQVDAGWLWYLFGDNPMINGDHKYIEIYARWYHKFADNFEGVPPKMGRIGSFADDNWTLAWMVHWWFDNNTYVVADVASNIEKDGTLPVKNGYNQFVRWLPVARSDFSQDSQQHLGRWYCCEIHIKLNTPGKSDGIYEYWIDNEKIIDVSGRNFSGYWNGSTINALQLDCYWNRGSPKDQSRFYDNLVISTSPIGLAVTSQNPILVKTNFSDDDEGDYQTAVQFQIASNKNGEEIVWESHLLEQSNNETRVDWNNGVFKNSLAGKIQLEKGKVYYVRVKQRDNNNEWSGWSNWFGVIRTTQEIDQNMGIIEKLKAICIEK